MRKNKKQHTSYFRMEQKLVEKLDRRITRAGFASRSDFFTAVAYVALYGAESLKRSKNAEGLADVEKLPKHVTEWVSQTIPNVSEEEILAGLHAIIDELLIPAIAMKGVDVTYENTWEDVRTVYHERCGVWVTESDIREAFVSYAAVHQGDLAEYRDRLMRMEKLAE